MKKSGTLLFLLYFYLAWFLCVWAGQSQDHVISLLLPIPALVFGFGRQRASLKIFILSLGLIGAGLFFDILGRFLGWIVFFPEPGGSILPIWLWSLWFLYLAYLPTMANIFQNRPGIGFLLGAVFGPLSYLSGEKFELVKFASAWGLGVYSVFWGIHFFCTIVLLRDSKYSTTQN